MASVVLPKRGPRAASTSLGSGGFQPRFPTRFSGFVRDAVVVDQAMPAQVGGRSQGTLAGQQGRAADQCVAGREHCITTVSLERSAAETDRYLAVACQRIEVYRRRGRHRRVDRIAAARQAQVDLRMGAGELGQAGSSQRTAKLGAALTVSASRPGGASFRSPRRGTRRPPAASAAWPSLRASTRYDASGARTGERQIVLERLDLLADRRGRDVQPLRRPP